MHLIDRDKSRNTIPTQYLMNQSLHMAAGSDEWVPLRQCDVKEQQCTIDFVSKWFAQSQFYIPFRQAPELFCPIARPRTFH